MTKGGRGQRTGAGPVPEATHVLAFSHTGYTTNLPLADVTGGKAWVTWEVDGAPLPADHGGPARLLVPHLYFWKSAKWVAGLTLGTTTSRASGSATATTPATLVGGGCGVVPLMSMLRLARRQGHDHPLRLVVSVRSPEDLLYAGELPGPDATVVFTRRNLPGSDRAPGRLTLADLPPPAPLAYVCGSSGFADAATALHMESGLPAGAIRVERFGPTGGA